MRCNHCKSRMIPTNQQREGRSEQTSYLCPLCGAIAASFRPIGERERAQSQTRDPAGLNAAAQRRAAA